MTDNQLPPEEFCSEVNKIAEEEFAKLHQDFQKSTRSNFFPISKESIAREYQRYKTVSEIVENLLSGLKFFNALYEKSFDNRVLRTRHIKFRISDFNVTVRNGAGNDRSGQNLNVTGKLDPDRRLLINSGRNINDLEFMFQVLGKNTSICRDVFIGHLQLYGEDSNNLAPIGHFFIGDQQFNDLWELLKSGNTSFNYLTLNILGLVDLDPYGNSSDYIWNTQQHRLLLITEASLTSIIEPDDRDYKAKIKREPDLNQANQTAIMEKLENIEQVTSDLNRNVISAASWLPGITANLREIGMFVIGALVLSGVSLIVFVLSKIIMKFFA